MLALTLTLALAVTPGIAAAAGPARAKLESFLKLDNPQLATVRMSFCRAAEEPCHVFAVDTAANGHAQVHPVSVDLLRRLVQSAAAVPALDVRAGKKDGDVVFEVTRALPKPAVYRVRLDRASGWRLFSVLERGAGWDRAVLAEVGAVARQYGFDTPGSPR